MAHRASFAAPATRSSRPGKPSEAARDSLPRAAGHKSGQASVAMADATRPEKLDGQSSLNTDTRECIYQGVDPQPHTRGILIKNRTWSDGISVRLYFFTNFKIAGQLIHTSYASNYRE